MRGSLLIAHWMITVTDKSRHTVNGYLIAS